MRPESEAGAKILDAAAELFAARGYAATSTRAIAEAAGVNEVTVFRRFESKLGVLRALGLRLAESQAGLAAADVPDSDSARDALLAFARMEIRGAIDAGGLAMRLAFDAQSVPEVGELLGEAIPRNLSALAEFIGERQKAGEIRDDLDATVLAEAFFSLTSSYVMYRQVMGVGELPSDVELDSGVEQLFELFWSGARPPK